MADQSPKALPSHELETAVLIDVAAILKKRHAPIAEYRGDPKRFFTERGAVFFPETARLFDDLYSLRVRKAVALAPRGGGKTYGAAVLATALFLFKNFDVGIVAGSETQALTLYSYITDWLERPEAEAFVTIEKLTSTYLVSARKNRIVARTASPKSIRGLHLGRKVRGALLILDEEAEAEPDVVRAARFIVRTAAPPLILRQSTYHRITGSFADLVENHKSQGYTSYKWDSFDIAKACPYECENCPEPEFRDKYCKGKAKHSQGWVSIDEILTEWRDTNRETFEVEVMGMRPASAGLVIQPGDLERAVDLGERAFPEEFDYSWCCIDWGFAGMTAIVIVGMAGERVFVRHTEMFTRHGIDVIVAKLKELRGTLGFREVYADASHPFENDRLRDEGFAVWGERKEKGPSTLGVPFVKFKEEGVAILSYLFEKNRIGVRAKEHALLQQFRSWRRDQAGHIIKKDDHFPDALIAGAQKLKQVGIGTGRHGRYVSGKHRLFATATRVGRRIREAFLS